jgi:hypothetical protein
MTPNFTNHIIRLRYLARRAVRAQRYLRTIQATSEAEQREAFRIGNSMAATAVSERLVRIKEALIDTHYEIIEIGRLFVDHAQWIDRNLSIDQICDAMNINPVHRRSDDFRKYGTSASRIVMTLQLENSATGSGGRFDYRIEDRPLVWCCQMAVFNTIETNPELGKKVHDEANRTFNGVFGEWREPSVLERCGIPLPMIQGSAP